jgi:hypothetical protein
MTFLVMPDVPARHRHAQLFGQTQSERPGQNKQRTSITNPDLEREGITSSSQLSNLLAGRREISKGLAKRLAVFFKVPLEVLL